jgi:ATP/maltotriose-dependent transcriptional regulator MalT
MTWEELIAEFETKAKEARKSAAKLTYKHQAVKAQYNIEASTLERCAERVREVLREQQQP